MGQRARHSWRAGKEVAGNAGPARTAHSASWDVGRSPDVFILLLGVGKQAVGGCGDQGRQPFVTGNKYVFLPLNSKMALGRRCSRCPRKRSSSALGCWTVRSRWAPGSSAGVESQRGSPADPRQVYLLYDQKGQGDWGPPRDEEVSFPKRSSKYSQGSV